MPKVSRTYRIEQETADRIADISESEGKTATEVVEAAIRAYSSEEYAGNTAKQADSTDSPALAALIDQLAVKDAQLAKKDEQIAKRIVAKLHEISQLEDPRSMGKGLTENKSGLWRYRVGDYRIVVDIEDDVLVILVVDVDHRSRVYRTRR